MMCLTEVLNFEDFLAEPPQEFLLSVIAVTALDSQGCKSTGRVLRMAPQDLHVELDSATCPRSGELLRLEISSDAYGFRVRGGGMAHCLRRTETGCETGVFLNRRLPDEILTRCWGDMRRELRFGGNWQLQVKSPRFPSHAPAVITDYSRSGLQFVAGTEFFPGEELEVLVNNRNAGKIITRWTKPSDYGFRHGGSSALDTGLELARLLGVEAPPSQLSFKPRWLQH